MSVATHARQGSFTYRGARRGRPASPRVQLRADLLTTAPADRAWTIAHELSHALRYQERSRPVADATYCVGLAVLGAWMVTAAAGAAYSDLLGSGTYTSLLLALIVPPVLGMLALMARLLARSRQDETETDATAAEVFAELPTQTTVHVMTVREGATLRHLPMILRTHPRPANRRSAALGI